MGIKVGRYSLHHQNENCRLYYALGISANGRILEQVNEAIHLSSMFSRCCNSIEQSCTFGGTQCSVDIDPVIWQRNVDTTEDE